MADSETELGDYDGRELPPQVPGGPRFSYFKQRPGRGGRFDGAIEKVGIALITAGLLSFVAFVFAMNNTIENQNQAISNLRETQAVQSASQQFLREQLADVKGRQDRIEGKVYRDAARELGLPDADQR